MNDISAMAQQAAMSGSMSQQAAREVSVLLSANTGPFREEMKKASSGAEQLADALHKVELAYKGALKFIGGGMIGLGASMQAGATGAIWSAVQFEEAFARVAKTTGLQNEIMGQTGATADFMATLGFGDNALQQFENDIRMLSTQIPVGVQELSHLADVAGTLGVESDNLVLFAETAAQLGAGINELGSDQAIAGLANLIGAFGMAEEQVVNLGSSLADLANHTRGNAGEMLQFSDRLAGTAVQVGMTAEEVLGLGAAVSAIGVQPQLGASAVTQVLTKMSRAVQQGGAELDKLARSMNMSSQELQDMWGDQGPTAVLMSFLESLSAQGEEATVTLQRLGLSGVNITQVFGGLAAQMHTVREAMGLSNEAFEDGTAVAELAEVRFNTVVKALQRFRQSTSEVFRSMGQGFLVIMKQMIDAVTGLVNVFNRLPQGIKTAMGLIAGFGGIALIAAGAFVMFYAQFHLFFIALNTLGALIPILITKLQALGGSGILAAQGLAGLQARLMALTGWFTTSSGAALGFSGILRKTLVSAAAALSKALTFLWMQLRSLVMWIAHHTWMDLVRSFKLMTTATTALSSRLLLLLIPFAKIAAIAAVIGGVIYALTGGKKAWAEATKEATGALREMAEATGMTVASLEELADVMIDTGFESGSDLAEEAKEVIDFLKELDEESAQAFLFRYGMMLLASGNPPDQVQRQIEELARLAGIPIVFEYDLRDMRHGEGFDELQDAIEDVFATAGQLNDQSDESWTSQAWNWVKGSPTPTTEGNMEDALAQISFAAQGLDLPGRIALAHTVEQDLDRALEEGDINQTTRDWIDEQLDEMNLVPESMQEDERSRLQRHRDAESNMSNWEKLKYAGATILPFTGQGYLLEDEFTPQQALAQAVEDETLLDSQHMDEIKEVISEITGETENFGEAVRNLDSEGFDRLSEGLMGLQGEINDTKAAALGLNEEFSTRIGEALFAADTMGDDADARRMLDAFFESLPHEIGFKQAIEEADTELQTLIDSGAEWGENADRLRRVIKEWGEEFARLHVQDIAQEINALPATEQVRRLTEELRNLDRESPYSAHIEIEIEQMRQQAFDASVAEFRQAMDQYDRLIEQREEAVRSHNERLEKMQEDHNRRVTRMEEDHNRRLARMEEDHTRRLKQMEEDRDKNIEQARESHAKRLEDIAKQEKDALEERVENMASAFDIMERIQARPSAEIGALRDNMVAQNRAMSEMTQSLDQLRSMGLSDDVMSELGFDDPQNFAAARRLLESALSDPGMIGEINRLWGERLDLSEAFVDETQADDIKSRFDEIREDARKALDEQIKEINERYHEQLADVQENYERQVADTQENYQRQLQDTIDAYTRSVDDANESHKRQLDQIAENLANLGQESLETINDLIEKASESGLEKLQEWADEIKDLQDEIREGVVDMSDLSAFEQRRRKEHQIANVPQMPTLPDRPTQGAFAEGGLRLPDEAKIQHSGTLVQWAEPETGGEAFIPLAPSKRDRSMEIWLKTGEILGMSFANGGARGLPRGREPMSSGGDLVGALTKALENASMGQSETNNWDVTVQAQDTRKMLEELEAKKRLARLTGGGLDL